MADLAAVGSSLTTESISNKSRHVRQGLLGLKACLDEMQQHSKSPLVSLASITDVTERFALWTGNLGALRQPESKLSLDSRLLDEADIRKHIHRQLDEMIDAIASRQYHLLPTEQRPVLRKNHSDKHNAWSSPEPKCRP